MRRKCTASYNHCEIVEEFLNGVNLISGTKHTIRSVAALYQTSKSNVHNILRNRYNTLTPSQQEACAERLTENKEIRSERAGRATAEIYQAKRAAYNLRELAIQFLESRTTLSRFAEIVDMSDSTLNRWFHVYLDKNDPLYALVKDRLSYNQRNGRHF